MSFYSPYRWCVALNCKNSTLKTPEKLFINVPTDVSMRNVWLELAGRDPVKYSKKSHLYLCEDHFDLEQDMENYMQYKIMGSVKKIRMKPGIIPSKFNNIPIVSPGQEAESSSTSVQPGSSTSHVVEVEEDENISHKADKEVQVQIMPVMEYKAVQVNLSAHYRSKATQINLKVRHSTTSPIKLSTSVATSPLIKMSTIDVPSTSGITRPAKRKLSTLFEDQSDSEISFTPSVSGSTSQDFSPIKVTTSDSSLPEEIQRDKKTNLENTILKIKKSLDSILVSLSANGWLQQMDWAAIRRDGHRVFAKLIRTKDPRESQGTEEIPVPGGRQKLSRCLSTIDLTSLGVGSCVGTGMYLVAGMVARKYAGPAVIFSFIIAAVASIFSGACYAEFGVRVPNTTGSAYTYTYVTVGEFIAFIIGWNMVLEYLIGTSACARALSASIDSILNGGISHALAASFGTIYGKPPDLVAFVITIAMTLVLGAGVKKSLFFNNLLNIINLSVWVFIVGAGMFYIDIHNWTDHKGFLPYGWSGVFTGAATCFYAFIGFDIIATTGEEANNPKRSIPLAIVSSLGIILLAYVSSSLILTLIVPYDEVDTDSALVQMFAHVNAPTCKYIVAVGALAGLTVSMFGSMFPMPRIIYAMALDGLIFKILAMVSERTGTPTLATMSGGFMAAVVSLLVQLEVLVEMMSIGTLLAYTLVSTCVLILRYQPHSTNLIELLPQSIRTPEPQAGSSGTRETAFGPSPSHRVMIRRVTRSSPDSDDTLPGEDDDDGRDDTFLVNSNTENKFYGAVPGGSCNPSRFGRFIDSISRKLNEMSYLCPGLFPWVDCGPPTNESGIYVIKAVGVMYVFIVTFDLIAAYGSPSTSTATTVTMVLLMLTIFVILILISRKPQNRVGLMYATPGLPFVPAIAIMVNIYLILNLSYLTLVRFTIWMVIGLIMYFKYGIKNSTLETNPPLPRVATPPPPNPLDRTTIPPASPRQQRPTGDRNIFEGDGNDGLFGNGTNAMYGNPINIDGFGNDCSNPLLSWHVAELEPSSSTSRNAPSTTYKQVETRYNARTNSTTSHTSSRPPWAYPDVPYETWND